jgi:hypothetical protein
MSSFKGFTASGDESVVAATEGYTLEDIQQPTPFAFSRWLQDAERRIAMDEEVEVIAIHFSCAWFGHGLLALDLAANLGEEGWEMSETKGYWGWVDGKEGIGESCFFHRKEGMGSCVHGVGGRKKREKSVLALFLGELWSFLLHHHNVYRDE